MAAMGIGFFDPKNPLVQINQKLHSSAAYNVFQAGVNALAIFTGAASSTMKCFVAGTMILTATGLGAIENIKAGNKIISADPETFEVAEKKVLETYIRETTKLVYLTISGELIKTTYDHPFYLKDFGVVSAGELYTGDMLLDSNGNVLIVEDRKVEALGEAVKVYKFQVEEFHAYHVGNVCVLVHNSNCIGENGTRTDSTTTWQEGKTERIDVENPAPGQRDGNIHYHGSKNIITISRKRFL